METRKDIYLSSDIDISTTEKCLAYLPESFKILQMKTFVGKNTQLKRTALGHAIMRAIVPRAFIAPPPPPPTIMFWCATALRHWAEISHRNITWTWFLFILSRSSEVSAKCCCFTTSWDSWLNAGSDSTVCGGQYMITIHKLLIV